VGAVALDRPELDAGERPLRPGQVLRRRILGLGHDTPSVKASGSASMTSLAIV
jgi:hypothetical protein